MATHSSILGWERKAWWVTVHGAAELDTTQQLTLPLLPWNRNTLNKVCIDRWMKTWPQAPRNLTLYFLGAEVQYLLIYCLLQLYRIQLLGTMRISRTFSLFMGHFPTTDGWAKLIEKWQKVVLKWLKYTKSVQTH